MGHVACLAAFALILAGCQNSSSEREHEIGVPPLVAFDHWEAGDAVFRYTNAGRETVYCDGFGSGDRAYAVCYQCAYRRGGQWEHGLLLGCGTGAAVLKPGESAICKVAVPDAADAVRACVDFFPALGQQPVRVHIWSDAAVAPADAPPATAAGTARSDAKTKPNVP